MRYPTSVYYLMFSPSSLPKGIKVGKKKKESFVLFSRLKRPPEILFFSGPSINLRQFHKRGKRKENVGRRKCVQAQVKKRRQGERRLMTSMQKKKTMESDERGVGFYSSNYRFFSFTNSQRVILLVTQRCEESLIPAFLHPSDVFDLFHKKKHNNSATAISKKKTNNPFGKNRIQDLLYAVADRVIMVYLRMKKPRMDGLILTTSNRERRVGKKKGGGMKGENRHGQPTAVDRQKETLGHSKNNVLLRNEKNKKTN